jgi:hypothetical protein
MTLSWRVGSLWEGSGMGGASCARAADTHTTSSAAAEKTKERYVMANM